MPHTPASIEELRDHLLAGREAVYRHWSITLVEHPEDRLYELYLNNLRVFTQGPRPTGWSGELDPDAPDGFASVPTRPAV